MPKTNIKLVTERSPEREELASAIVAAEEARRGAENARSAVSLAKQIVADASQKHAGAGDALIAAKEAHSTRIATAASSGEALSPDSTLRNARVAEVDAADELHAARDALTSLEAALEDPEADDRRAQKRVAKAVEGVIFSKVADKLAALREEQQALGERRLVLELMLHHLDHFADGRREMRSKIDGFLFNICAFPVNGFEQWKTHPATQAWREAVEALAHDADAILPMEAAR